MSQAKFSPAVYAALSAAGMSNRRIADELGVDEASVRRGLKKADAVRINKERRRVTYLVVEETA